MTTVASGGELLTTVAEGLLSSLGTSPLALTTARSMLDDDTLDEAAVRERLTAIVEAPASCDACGVELQEGVCENCGFEEADGKSDAEVPAVLERLKKRRKPRRRKKGKAVLDQLQEGFEPGKHPRGAGGKFRAYGAATVGSVVIREFSKNHVTVHHDFEQTGHKTAALRSLGEIKQTVEGKHSVKKIGSQGYYGHKEFDNYADALVHASKGHLKRSALKGLLQEARVTGNPPVPNSPTSQTGPEAAQTDPWGGPNAAVAVAAPILLPQPPPNLRKADDWESCDNCVFFHKGCNLYGLGRNGKPDVVHRGQWPVKRDDLCDSHATVTPEAVRRSEVYARERGRLDKALTEGSGADISVARAREAAARGRLEEFIHLPSLGGGAFDKLKHPRAAKGRKGGGQFASTTNAISKLKPMERHNVALGVNVYHDPESGYTVLGHGRALSSHGKDAAAAAREAHKVAAESKRIRSLPSRERHRYITAAEMGGAAEIKPMLEEVKSDAYPGLDRSPKENWVDKAGGLPRYIERIAKHLHYEKGKEIGHAIAIAVNVVKKMCASGDTNFPGKQNVKAKSRAEACAAVAQWEAKKGKSKAKTAAKKVAEASSEEILADFALAEAAVDFRPFPPSENYILKLHEEIARQDGPRWWLGLALLDEADAIKAEHPTAELSVEENKLSYRIPGISHGNWDPIKHPRVAKGRKGGGQFGDVLSKLSRDARAGPGGRRSPSLGGAARGRGRRVAGGPKIPKRPALEKLSAPELADLHHKVFGGERPHDRFIGRGGEMAMVEKLDRARPFKGTHEYHPGLMDRHDPNVIEGKAIEPGSHVRIVNSKVDPLGKLVHVEDEHGNRQSVWKRALLRPNEVSRRNPPLDASHGPFLDQMNGQKGATPAKSMPARIKVKDRGMRRSAKDRVNGYLQYGRKEQALQADDGGLAIDHAIGAVLQSHGDQLKDWHVSGPDPIGGKKTWTLNVELKDGGKHTIHVNEDGGVHEVGAPGEGGTGQGGGHAAHMAAAEKIAPFHQLEPTGETEKPFHMPDGTFFQGKDGHTYQKIENTKMMGKKGPLAAVTIKDHTYGTEKTAPAFALSTYYSILDQPGAGGGYHPPGGNGGGDGADVYELLKKSVASGTVSGGDLNSLSGKHVVVTGKIPGMTRDEFYAKLKAAGATVHSSVTNQVDYLITGENVGKTKVNAAQAKGAVAVPFHSISHLLEAPSDEDRLYGVILALRETTATNEIIRLRARGEALQSRLEEGIGGLFKAAFAPDPGGKHSAGLIRPGSTPGVNAPLIQPAPAHFDPAKHPKDRVGKFRSILANAAGGDVTLPSGVNVRVDAFGFTVRDRAGNKVKVHGGRADAASRAAALALRAHEQGGTLPSKKLQHALSEIEQAGRS